MKRTIKMLSVILMVIILSKFLYSLSFADTIGGSEWCSTCESWVSLPHTIHSTAPSPTPVASTTPINYGWCDACHTTVQLPHSCPYAYTPTPAPSSSPGSSSNPSQSPTPTPVKNPIFQTYGTDLKISNSQNPFWLLIQPKDGKRVVINNSKLTSETTVTSSNNADPTDSQIQTFVKSGKGAQAVATARTYLGSTAYNGLCLPFVYKAYGVGGQGLGSPMEISRNYKLCKDLSKIPAGALVIFSYTTNGVVSADGHIGVASGNGNMISARSTQMGGVVEQTISSYYSESGKSFLGWMLPTPGMTAVK